MRPGALTPAARSGASRQDDVGARTTDRPRVARAVREAPGERRVSRASRTPRRVSGPTTGKDYASRPQSAGGPPRQAGASRGTRAARATRATGTTSGGRSIRPSRAPRGVFASGSAAVAAAVALPLRRPFIDRKPAPRRAPKPVPAPTPAKTAKPTTGILRGIGAFVISLPDHSLLDRVVRGRAWIPLLGVLLAGIVAAQVEILKLGASMGRSLEQTTTLTGQNELLRDSVASLSDDQRIERLATNMGMVLPPPGAVGYLTAGQGGGVIGALGNVHVPNAAAFMALAPSNGALVTGPGTSMLPTSSGVLAQAGTPASATPTTTPSATSTVTPSGAAASSGTTTAGTSSADATGTTGTTGATGATGAIGTAGTAGTAGTPTDTTGSGSPPAEQAPPVTTNTPATAPTDSQGATAGAQSTPSDSQTGSQAPATGAAAIQPAGPTQQTSGG